MDMLLTFGIGANPSTFEQPRCAMPHFEMGVFKTGFAVILDHRQALLELKLQNGAEKFAFTNKIMLKSAWKLTSMPMYSKWRGDT